MSALSLSSLTMSVVLAALAAPASALTSSAGAADVTAADVTSSHGAASQIAEIQRRLTAVIGVTAPEEAVDALARSLTTVRGVQADAAPITSLAAVVADVLARGALAEYEIERFAQGLFTASRDAALPDRDAGLLAIDLALLLQEAGADSAGITDVLAALQRVCPAAKLPPSGIPARPAATRRLSVLSRP